MLRRKPKGAEFEKKVYIDGPMDKHLAMKITEELCKVSGLSYINVDHKKGYADLYFPTFFPGEAVRKAIEGIGFKVTKIEDVIR